MAVCTDLNKWILGCCGDCGVDCIDGEVQCLFVTLDPEPCNLGCRDRSSYFNGPIEIWDHMIYGWQLDNGTYCKFGWRAPVDGSSFFKTGICYRTNLLGGTVLEEIVTLITKVELGFVGTDPLGLPCHWHLIITCPAPSGGLTRVMFDGRNFGASQYGEYVDERNNNTATIGTCGPP